MLNEMKKVVVEGPSYCQTISRDWKKKSSAITRRELRVLSWAVHMHPPFGLQFVQNDCHSLLSGASGLPGEKLAPREAFENRLFRIRLSGARISMSET